MRKNLVVGLVLAIAAVVGMAVSAAFELELEPVLLLGLGVGSVLALVPEGTAVGRLAAFVGGVLVSLVGYLVRAAVLPDTRVGQTVAMVVVILACLGVYAAGLGRLPLWSALLGAGSLAGAYELTYTVAPPQVVTTSATTLTSLLLAVAVGFVASALAAGDTTADRPSPGRRRDVPADDVHPLDSMMEPTK